MTFIEATKELARLKKEDKEHKYAMANDAQIAYYMDDYGLFRTIVKGGNKWQLKKGKGYTNFRLEEITSQYGIIDVTHLEEVEVLQFY